MRFYQNFLDNIALTGPEQILSNMQEFINQNWDKSTQTTGEHSDLKAFQQKEIGSEEYLPVEISVDMMSALSTGQKISDDYKIFTHRYLTDNTTRGLMYLFADNYWVSADVDEIASPIKNVGVRRCNQQLKWIDKDSGNFYTEWCVIDLDLASPNPKVDKDLTTPNGHVVLIVQGNEKTRTIKKNQRFIFSGQPFKLTGVNNFLQNGIVDNSTTIFYYDLYIDEIQPTDDLVNNIANAGEYIYDIQIIQNPIEQIKGFTGKFDTVIKFNSEIINKNPVWSSNEFGTILPDGTYEIIGDVGDIAIFTATYGMVSQTREILIVDTIVDKFELRVDPIVTEILQGENIDLIATLYKNGEDLPDIVTASISGGDSIKCYNFIQIDTNKWNLKNNFRSIQSIEILFESGIYSYPMQIKLKAIF